MAYYLSRGFALMVLLVYMLSQLGSPAIFYNRSNVRECSAEFSKVHDWLSLEKFLLNVRESMVEGPISESDAGQCLNIGWRRVFKYVHRFNMLLRDARRSQDICIRLSNYEMLGMHPRFISKGGLLVPWWEKLMKQILVDCKLDLPERLKSRDSEGTASSYMIDILELARNFNWKDPKHFVIKDDTRDKGIRGKTLNDFADLVQSSGRLDEISRLDVIDWPISKERKILKHEVELTKRQVYNIEKMFRSCVYVYRAKDRLFDPVLRLFELGYDDSELGIDEKISSSFKPINAWLASIQMCQVFEHIRIYSMGNVNGKLRVRFRAGPAIKSIDEAGAAVIKYDKLRIIGDENKVDKSCGRPEAFQEFLIDDDSIKLNLAKEKKRQKEVKDSARTLRDAISSKEFLSKLAEYFQAN